MSRKLNAKYSLILVGFFIAIVTLLIALAALVPIRSAAQTPRQANAALAPAPISASAGSEQRSTNWSDGAECSPVSRSQTQQSTAQPGDSNSPLFLFMPVVTYGSGETALSIGVADVNGDGKPDLIVASANNTVGILLGNGDGTFQPVVDYGSGGWAGAQAVAVADVNGDGKPDLIVANYCGSGSCTGGVGVLLGNGDGTFKPVVTYSSGGFEAVSIAVADVNRDGKPDVIVLNRGTSGPAGGVIGVLIGNGDGTFQPAITYSSGTAFGHTLAVADVNGDGKPDLVLGRTCDDYSGTCNNVDLVGVMLGNGDGSFQPVVSYSSGVSWEYQSSVVVADVNGDGKPDLLATNFDAESVAVLLGNDDGTFRPAVTYSAGSQGYTSSVVAADVNGDGKVDILTSNSGVGNGADGSVSLLLGNGDGTFQQATVYDSGAYDAWSLAAADVNKDGKPDVLVTNYAPAVGVLLNNYGAPPTTTELVSNANPANPLEVVTYAANVTSQSAGSVTGTVTFEDGGGTIATLPLLNNQASYSTSYKKVSAHAITASYWGELHVAFGSESATLMEYVPGASRTVLTTSGSPSFVGQPVTFTATVTSAFGKIPVGELVTFSDGTATLGSVALVGGTATYTTSALSAKGQIIKATYAGCTIFKPSDGTVKQVVDKYATTTALGSSANPSSYKQAITFTATVASAGPAPTGKVTFKDGATAIGTVTLSGGLTKLTTSKLVVGTHTITAEYLGDADSATSTSAVLDQVVQ